MITTKFGKVVKGLGGLYETRVASENGIERLSCRAKGVLKRDEEKVFIGDNVKILCDDSTPDGLVISEIVAPVSPLRNLTLSSPSTSSTLPCFTL